MTGAQAVLVGVTVAIQVAVAFALFTVRDPFDRLHLTGAVSVLATFPLVAAVLLGATSKTHVAKVVATGLFLWLTSPFLTRATARALRIRATGRLSVSADEVDEEQPR